MGFNAQTINPKPTKEKMNTTTKTLGPLKPCWCGHPDRNHVTFEDDATRKVSEQTPEWMNRGEVRDRIGCTHIRITPQERAEIIAKLAHAQRLAEALRDCLVNNPKHFTPAMNAALTAWEDLSGSRGFQADSRDNARVGSDCSATDASNLNQSASTTAKG